MKRSASHACISIIKVNCPNSNATLDVWFTDQNIHHQPQKRGRSLAKILKTQKVDCFITFASENNSVFLQSHKMTPDLTLDFENSAQQHYSAHNPIEQYVLLSKSAKGAACLELIKQVLEAPGVYVFGELLAMPNIAEVGNRWKISPGSCLIDFLYFSFRTVRMPVTTIR